MLDLLSGFIDILNTLFTLLINVLKSVVVFITSMPKFMKFTIDSINLLPPTLIAFALVSISTYLLLFVLGRGE